VIETLLAGARKADHVSIPHQIVDQIRQEVDQIGRLQQVGDFYAAAASRTRPASRCSA
jgi:hypothetical protein